MEGQFRAGGGGFGNEYTFQNDTICCSSSRREDGHAKAFFNRCYNIGRGLQGP
jgi:hypothetical protein